MTKVQLAAIYWILRGDSGRTVADVLSCIQGESLPRRFEIPENYPHFKELRWIAEGFLNIAMLGDWPDVLIERLADGQTMSDVIQYTLCHDANDHARRQKEGAHNSMNGPGAVHMFMGPFSYTPRCMCD